MTAGDWLTTGGHRGRRGHHPLRRRLLRYRPRRTMSFRSNPSRIGKSRLRLRRLMSSLRFGDVRGMRVATTNRHRLCSIALKLLISRSLFVNSLNRLYTELLLLRDRLMLKRRDDHESRLGFLSPLRNCGISVMMCARLSGQQC